MDSASQRGVAQHLKLRIAMVLLAAEAAQAQIQEMMG